MAGACLRELDPKIGFLKELSFPFRRCAAVVRAEKA
jgi:hypothetical protein